MKTRNNGAHAFFAMIAVPRAVCQSHRSSLLASVRASPARLGAYLAARRERAREICALQAFSDRELWDMGLRRYDLRAIVKGTYQRD